MDACLLLGCFGLGVEFNSHMYFCVFVNCQSHLPLAAFTQCSHQCVCIQVHDTLNCVSFHWSNPSGQKPHNAQNRSGQNLNEKVKPLPKDELLSITKCCLLNVWSQERFSAKWTDFDAQKPSGPNHNERLNLCQEKSCKPQWKEQTFAKRRVAFNHTMLAPKCVVSRKILC